MAQHARLKANSKLRLPGVGNEAPASDDWKLFGDVVGYRHWTFPDEHASAISSTGVSYMMGKKLQKRAKAGTKPGGILEQMASRMVDTPPPVKAIRSGAGIGALTEEYTAEVAKLNDEYDAAEKKELEAEEKQKQALAAQSGGIAGAGTELAESGGGNEINKEMQEKQTALEEEEAAAQAAADLAARAAAPMPFDASTHSMLKRSFSKVRA